MVAVTVGGEARRVDDISESAMFPLCRHIGFPCSVTAAKETAFYTGISLSVAREQLNDAAGVIAIDRGVRPAQDLDALCGVEIERRGLALPIGHGRGDAVPDEAHAADPECGSRAKPAR